MLTDLKLTAPLPIARAGLSSMPYGARARQAPRQGLPRPAAGVVDARAPKSRAHGHETRARRGIGRGRAILRQGWARHAAGDSPSHHGHGAGYGFATQPCSGGAIFLMASIAPIITSAFRTPAFRRLVAISCCASAC